MTEVADTAISNDGIGDNGTANAVASIHSGLESQLLVHEENEVFHGNDDAEFTVIEALVSTPGHEDERHPLLFAQVRGGRPSAVCVAVRDGKLLLAQHWRVATDSFEWEFPRSMGTDGEIVSTTAERELLAEAGVHATGRRLLQMIHADTCKLRDSVAVVEVSVDPSDDAGIPRTTESTFAWLRPEEIDQMIADGGIADGTTLAAYLIWKTHRASETGEL